MPSYQQQRTVSRIFVQPSIVRPHPSNMQWLRIELLPRVTRLCLPACPPVIAYVSPPIVTQFSHWRRFVFGPQGAQHKLRQSHTESVAAT
jgi:hypothetical protein